MTEPKEAEPRLKASEKRFRLAGGTVKAKSGGQGMGREFVIDLPVTIALNTRPTPRIVYRSEGVMSARHRLWVADDLMEAAD